MPAKSRRGSRGGWDWNCCGRHYDPPLDGYEAHQSQMTTLVHQAAFGFLSMMADKGQV